ncbi:YolD-like family protein [Psychrobacillus glaciei]|uniref:YolD-like family protein n=1 Tax=Psychrobacillus glaciei TaxID=2283160 RepID=A0A5J6SNV0_9BACI|nr:YolD-like family protein [Psychrobacillus glaciei]QFF99595.1 YolD-like family protein [Psychrobacillus glaciei]
MTYLNDHFDEKLDLSKIRDRGSKKWVAMMLPEHVRLIREYNDASKKEPRPQLDEWDLEEIQQLIEIAMKRNVEVEMKIWKNGEFIYQVGRITWVDLNKRVIEMEDIFQSFTLTFGEIVNVTIFE